MLHFFKYSFYILITVSLICLNAYIIASIWADSENQKNRAVSAVQSEVNRQGASSNGQQNGQPGQAAMLTTERKKETMLDVAPLKQHPELYNGCEITALTIVLRDYGIDKNKLQLTKELIHDPTPLKETRSGRITHWGDPATGFVGDITGKNKGLGVYHGPILDLMKKYIPTAQNLTNAPFEELERYVSAGSPVIVWTTVNFTVPAEGQWVTWEAPTGKVKATFQMHAVVLVGYDEHYVYVNDPQTGQKAKKLSKAQFTKTWEAMGKQALSYIPAE